jgi:hypothetical protein
MTARTFRRVVLLSAVALWLSACGFMTPNYEEFWGNGKDTNKQLALIVENAKCELARATRLVMAENKEALKVNGDLVGFLNTWAADVLFQFTIDEKTTFAPGISYTPPLSSVTDHFANGTVTTTTRSESFNLGGQFSSEGYRQDKLHSFYKLSDLVGPIDKLPLPKEIQDQPCVQKNESGTLLLVNDLKFYEWLNFVATVQILNEGDFRAKNAFVSNGVIVHDVKFDIMSAGNFTPTIKLFRISANTGASSLFNTSRDRTQEIIITLGPVSSTPDQLKEKAASSANASELKAGFDSTISRVTQ